MPKSDVKSAGRTLEVLLYLSTRAQPVPTSTIAQACGLPRSSTYHLLNAMLEHDFVSYFPKEHRWGLGVAAFEIGSAYLRNPPLERLARPLLAKLVAEIGETAHLGILHGADVLYLAKNQAPDHPTPLVTDLGVRLPAHLTAIGKAILMHQSEAQIRALFLPGRPMANRTGKGPRTRADLLLDLSESRKRGFAIEQGQTTESITCIAASVFDDEERAVAAVGISFWSAAHDAHDHQRLGRQVIETASDLSGRIGWSDPDPGRSRGEDVDTPI